MARPYLQRHVAHTSLRSHQAHPYLHLLGNQYLCPHVAHRHVAHNYLRLQVVPHYLCLHMAITYIRLQGALPYQCLYMVLRHRRIYITISHLHPTLCN